MFPVMLPFALSVIISYFLKLGLNFEPCSGHLTYNLGSMEVDGVYRYNILIEMMNS